MLACHPLLTRDVGGGGGGICGARCQMASIAGGAGARPELATFGFVVDRNSVSKTGSPKPIIGLSATIKVWPSPKIFRLAVEGNISDGILADSCERGSRAPFQLPCGSFTLPPASSSQTLKDQSRQHPAALLAREPRSVSSSAPRVRPSTDDNCTTRGAPLAANFRSLRTAHRCAPGLLANATTATF